MVRLRVVVLSAFEADAKAIITGRSKLKDRIVVIDCKMINFKRNHEYYGQTDYPRRIYH